MVKHLKLLAFVLAVMLLAACQFGGNPEDAQESEDRGEAEITGMEDSWELPEIDGFEKQVQQDLVVYSSESGSAILVQLSPADEDTIAALRSRDASAQALTAEVDAILAPMKPGEHVQGIFENIGGRDVFTANALLESGEQIVFYKLLDDDGDVYDILGTGRGIDVADPMGEIAAAL